MWQFLKSNKFNSIFFKKHTHLLTNYGKRHESKIIWSHGKTNSKNAAIAFKRNLKISVVNIFPDKNGRYVFAEIALKLKRLCLANAYGPNHDNPMFFFKCF